MKIKIIDLLSRIANNEFRPEYIRYFNTKNNEQLVMLVCKENIIYQLSEGAIDLNDEVEIVGTSDPKKDNFTGWKMYQDGIEVCSMDISDKTKSIEKLSISHFARKQKQLAKKINEVIDKINGMENL